MSANPEPNIIAPNFDSEGAIVEGDASRPDFLSVAFGQLLEMQGGVEGVLPQECELFIRSGADLRRQIWVVLPKVRMTAVHAD